MDMLTKKPDAATPVASAPALPEPPEPPEPEKLDTDGAPGAADERAADEPPAQLAGRMHQKVHAKVLEAGKELRFVSERPNSLRDHIAYAVSGEWTDQIDGRLRHLALIYVWMVAIPNSTIAYLWVWASARPIRFASFLAVTLTVNTALNQIPVVEWLIPDWATLTYWPPLCWF
jgi:hypothetical protein